MNLLPRKNLSDLAFDRKIVYYWNKYSSIPSRIAFALGARVHIYRVLRNETLY